MEKKKVIIMGAAGRDFHNFNTFFRDNEEYEVVAFTATQIPGVDDKMYPAELAGKLYPNGIRIQPEESLEKLIADNDVKKVVLAYSDLTYEYVMDASSRANSAGADFCLMGTEHTMIKSSKPVIAVCAARTGCGKSQTSRYISQVLKDAGVKVSAIRHPMPYGDLAKQAVQRFAEYPDLDTHECTIEEREEYEPYIDEGLVIYAGVDYQAILDEAEKEADVILWDGGNNDFSFYKADLYITVVDPLRVGHELTYYPGEVNVRLADIIIINKVDTAKEKDLKQIRTNLKKVNPNATIIEAESPPEVENPDELKGKKVLVIEDGPTVTHGGMPLGIGKVAADKYGATPVDPKQAAAGSIMATFKKFPHLTEILPAMGYSAQQCKDLEETINNTDCDLVLAGTPIDLNRVVKVEKPIVRVRYNYHEKAQDGVPTLKELVLKAVGK